MIYNSRHKVAVNHTATNNTHKFSSQLCYYMH